MKIASRARSIETGGIVSRTDFTIKPGAHIMSVLSGLYKDPVDAMVREYLTNMFDAVKALLRVNPSAKVLPATLRLPTSLSQELVFADNGIGMSCETVMEVYSQYGNSTKNDSNLEVGGFGLGSKTAFCYNNGSTWTIESRYDGQKHVFMACIGEHGVPQLAHVSSTPTKEHSGVTVRIPIMREDIGDCYDAATRYVPYFTLPLTIEGDGRKVPEPVEYAVRGEKWGIRKEETPQPGYYHSRNRQWRIVMGNVPYDIDFYELRLDGMYSEFYSNNFDLYVPIGSVDIVPSRDNLKMTERTKHAIKSAMAEVKREIGPLLETRLAGAKTEWEALLTFSTMNDISGINKVVKSLKWNGKVLNTQFGVQCTVADIRKLDPTVEVKQFGVIDTDHSTIDAKEITAGTDKLSLRTKNTWLVVEDMPKGIQKVKSLLFEKLVHKTHVGRTARYGHTIGHAIVIKSKLTREKLSDVFHGYPAEQMLLVSELRGGKLPSSMKSSVDTIYRWNGRAWDARVNIPEDGEYFILTLEKGNTGRYVWEKVKDSYSPADKTLELIRFAETCGVNARVGTLYGVKSDEKSKIDKTIFTDLQEAIQSAVVKNATENVRAWAMHQKNKSLSPVEHENTLIKIFKKLGVPTSDPRFAGLNDAFIEREKFRAHPSVHMLSNSEFFTDATKKTIAALIEPEIVEDPRVIITELFAEYPMLGMLVDLLGLTDYYNSTDQKITKYRQLLLDFFASLS